MYSYFFFTLQKSLKKNEMTLFQAQQKRDSQLFSHAKQRVVPFLSSASCSAVIEIETRAFSTYIIFWEAFTGRPTEGANCDSDEDCGEKKVPSLFYEEPGKFFCKAISPFVWTFLFEGLCEAEHNLLIT